MQVPCNLSIFGCSWTIYHDQCLNFFLPPTLTCALDFSTWKMSTLTTIRQLIKDISTFSNSLLDSVLKGSKDDKIWSVMNTEECNTPHETFNWQFDALFTEDCHDSDGHLHLVRWGKLGMGLVVSYLSKINWMIGFPLDLVELKLHHLITELKVLQYVPDSTIHHLYS